MFAVMVRLRNTLQRRLQPCWPQTLPITIKTRQVYLLPTRFGLFLASVLATMLLGGLNYNNSPGLLLALGSCAIYLSSALLAHLNIAAIAVESVAAITVHAGQPLPLHLTLRVAGKRARYALRLTQGDCQARCSLRPRQSTSITLTLPTRQRGWYPLQPLTLDTVYPLGLFRAWSIIWPRSEILVYPALETDNIPLPHAATQTQTQTQTARTPCHDDDQINPLRPYRPGDPLHAIAWKASARRMRLLTHPAPLTSANMLILAWQDLHGLAPEQRIARLSRWIILAEQQRIDYCLHLPDHPVVGPDHGPEHSHHCLRALALLANEPPNTSATHTH